MDLKSFYTFALLFKHKSDFPSYRPIEICTIGTIKQGIRDKEGGLRYTSGTWTLLWVKVKVITCNAELYTLARFSIECQK